MNPCLRLAPCSAKSFPLKRMRMWVEIDFASKPTTLENGTQRWIYSLRKGEAETNKWSFFSLILQEEEAFNYAVSIYGIDDVAAIQALVRTRTKIQVRNRTSKASLIFRVPTCWVHSDFQCISHYSMHFHLVTVEDQTEREGVLWKGPHFWSKVIWNLPKW